MSEANIETFDVVVIGMGPAGAVLSTHLAQRGLSVLALERASFPRYRIGESLTGIAGDRICELGLQDQMPGIDAIKKSGVKVVGKEARAEFFVPVPRLTWQLRRAEFDDILLKNAVKRGVTVRQGGAREVIREGDRVVGIRHELESAPGESREARCRFVADCSGHSAFLSRAGVAGTRETDVFGRQIAVFSQFEHAIRDPDEMANGTVIFYASQHHWAWFIPVSPTLTSVGIVVPTETYKSVRGDPAQVFDWGVQNINPELRRRVGHLKHCDEVRVIRNYSYRIEPFAGDGWLCVGDAHRFTDPIFSYGVSIAMTEAKKAADTMCDVIAGKDEREAMRRYARFCTIGQNAATDLIRYFWTFPTFFAYQTRGKLRDQYVKLLAGDLYDEEPVEALVSMRESLAAVSLRQPTPPETADMPTPPALAEAAAGWRAS